MRASITRISLALVMAAILLAGCGDEDGEQQPGGAHSCTQESPPSPRKADFQPPKQTVKPGEKLTAVMKTSCGTFDIALDTARSPKTTDSFVYLARKGFYDGLPFHRIAPGFVIQGGDPLGRGTGGPGYQVDEKPPPNLAYTKGVVAMAKTEVEPPGRSGSQFFIVTVPDAGLSPDFALVGRVDQGMNVVDRIASLGTPSQQPRQTVLIKRLTIERG